MFSTTAPQSSTRSTTNEETSTHRSEARVIVPTLDHGGDIWRVAKDSGELDLNSSYMYLLFARDFAETCRVAVTESGDLVGFVLAYRRTEEPDCLFVWQVAVDESRRGEGLAKRMLDDLIAASANDETPIRTLETTVTDDNIASRKLFTRLADRWGTKIKTRALFDESHFPDDHETERLHLIGPLDASERPE